MSQRQFNHACIAIGAAAVCLFAWTAFMWGSGFVESWQDLTYSIYRIGLGQRAMMDAYYSGREFERPLLFLTFVIGAVLGGLIITRHPHFSGPTERDSERI